MLTLIEAHNFRCLRYIRQPLGPVHVLVGPNASGKTTFLDVVAFLSDLVTQGLDEAIRARTQNPYDLLWKRQGTGFELAIEARIPPDIQERIEHPRVRYEIARYELKIGFQATQEVAISAEKVFLKPHREETRVFQRSYFPDPQREPSDGTILALKRGGGGRAVVTKMPDGNDNFYPETREERGKRWVSSFKLGSRKSALGGLPADESAFPTATWLKSLLTEGVQPFVLNSLHLRRASPPGQGRGFRPDGSNLPWVVKALCEQAPERFGEWIAHLRTALPDLLDIRTIEREDDRHCYLMLKYQGVDGETFEIPSWVASDGTLRLLALTLPAYLPNLTGIYLIEEPENGIHPKAVETMFESLSSVYDAQVLMATHSPVVVSLTSLDQVLCFAKTEEGATDIVLGKDHPQLQQWRKETSLGELFATGVLG